LAGSFEAAFSGLGNLKFIDIGNTKVDCTRTLELLPSMPWATQLENLGLAETNAKGKKILHAYLILKNECIVRSIVFVAKQPAFEEVFTNVLSPNQLNLI